MSAQTTPDPHVQNDGNRLKMKSSWRQRGDRASPLFFATNPDFAAPEMHAEMSELLDVRDAVLEARIQRPR